MKDTIVTGSAVGVAVTLVGMALEGVLSKAGMIPPVTFQYISILILPPGHVVPHFLRMATVFIAALAASCIFGSLLAYFYTRTGGDFWLIKGAVWGGFQFILHVALIPKLWEPRLLPLLAEPRVIVWEVLDKIGWAILSAYMISVLLRNTRLRSTAP